MTILNSIRTKLTLWYAGILGVTLVCSGVIAYIVTRSTLFDSLDISLKKEVKWVSESIEPKAKKVKLRRAALKELQELQRTAAQQEEQPEEEEDSTEEQSEIDAMWRQIYEHTLLSPRRHYIQILDRNSDLLYKSQSLQNYHLTYNDIPYQTINVVTTVGANNELVRLALMQNDYVKIFVAYPLNPVYETLNDIFSNFIIIGPIALLISIIGGWFLAHKSLKPVDELTAAAKEITAQNLNRRLPKLKVNDELGRLTAQFNDMIGRLQASFVQIQQFSADASHELRTPLTIMRGEIEVALRNQKMPKDMRELLSSIHDELIRLSSITENLMTLIKSDTGRLAFDIKPLALDLLINQLYEEAKVLAETKNIRLKLKSAEPAHIMGDNARLKQLFLNIIDNAIKYSNPEGIVTLSLKRDNGFAIVVIEDNGIGIPGSDLGKIFDRFYRVERNGSGDDVASGSGLGLPISKWIAEAHHGNIDVQSEELKGSTFRIRLPLM